MMAYTNAHLLIRLHGHFGSGPTTPLERWSTGFRVGIPTQDVSYDETKLQTFANAVHTAAQTFHQHAQTLAGSNCYFTHVTAARIGESGKYDPVGQLTIVSTGPTQAGAGTPNQAWNVALSYGLRTAAPRGPASNGRCYYPFLAPVIVTGTGRVQAGQVTGRLAQFRIFLNAVNTAALAYELATGVQVMSSVGAGKTERVLSLRADDRLDSIERRENDQAIVYQTLAL